MPLESVNSWLQGGFHENPEIGSAYQQTTEEFDKQVRIGITSGRLLSAPQDWITRQVDHVEFLNNYGCRRRTSIDFCLPADYREELTSNGRIIVPITLLDKKRLRRFDLRDEDNRVVPKLGRTAGSYLTHVTLLALASQIWMAGDDPPEEVYELVEGDLWPIAGLGKTFGRQAVTHMQLAADRGDRWRGALMGNEYFSSLLHQLADSFVLYAAITDEGADQRVIKFAYDDEISVAPKWPALEILREPKQVASDLLTRARYPDRNWFQIACPGVDRGMSFHLDLAVPEDQRIRYIWMADADLLDEGPDAAMLPGRGQTEVKSASIYLPNDDPTTRRNVVAFASVAAERNGQLLQALGTSALVAGLLWSTIEFRPGTGFNQEAAASTILVGAAILSGFSAASESSTFGTHGAIKRWLAISSICALIFSAAIALSAQDDFPVTVCRWTAVLATIAFLRLFWSFLRAPGRSKAVR